MSFKLELCESAEPSRVELPTSKSIANRLLILQAIGSHQLKIENLSESEDTAILRNALKSDAKEINVGMAGTAFRFLTAYYSISEGTKVITGAERMKKRPIALLVDALRKLGAEIEYLGEQGFPPLRIKGKQLSGVHLNMNGNISSQYITALLLIGSKIQGGLTLQLKGEVVSKPYIQMTVNLLNEIGVEVDFSGSNLKVQEGDLAFNKSLKVEKDWSSAAFFYQVCLFSNKQVLLNNLHSDSIQGDKRCADLFKEIGVYTDFYEEGARLRKLESGIKPSLEVDLTDCPDLIPAFTVAVSQVAKRTTIVGTKTLYIKESNRVEALQTELEKIGIALKELTKNSIEIYKEKDVKVDAPISFNTYNDHRLAMSLAPLRLIYSNIKIDSKDVVNKSFPNFWEELERVGISIN